MTTGSQPAAPRPPGGDSGHLGDVDLAAVGALVALPASRLAAEAGVSPATASSHLAKLVGAGLLAVERQGRHRFFRLSGPGVGQLIEALAQLAPAQPVRSLRQGTRAEALRTARTCYDHLCRAAGCWHHGRHAASGLSRRG